MMVTKIWNTCFPETKVAHVYRHSFYLCQWQRSTQVGILYLLYRWLSAILFLAVLACSLLDIGRTEPMYDDHYAKWWIYLTHWGLLACTLQAWLGAWIVTSGLMVQREEFEIQRQAKKSIFHKLYWILYTIATVYSFIITVCYWAFVYDPAINRLDAVNIMVHVLNSLLMFIDLAVVGQPITLYHAYWTTGIGFAYTIFSVVYYVAGGTDRRNSTCIYPLLDWSKPGKSIVVSAAGLFFVFIVHLLCYSMYRLRVWIFTKACLREGNEKLTSIHRTLSSLEDNQRENFLNSNTIIDLKV